GWVLHQERQPEHLSRGDHHADPGAHRVVQHDVRAGRRRAAPGRHTAAGADKIRAMATKFGFESTPTIDRDEKNSCFLVAPSTVGSMTNTPGKADPAATAQSSIGQFQVVMTPLQGAMMAPSIAYNGSQMRPYLVQQLKAADLTTVHYTAQPKELRRSVS